MNTETDVVFRLKSPNEGFNYFRFLKKQYLRDLQRKTFRQLMDKTEKPDMDLREYK